MGAESFCCGKSKEEESNLEHNNNDNKVLENKEVKLQGDEEKRSLNEILNEVNNDRLNEITQNIYVDKIKNAFKQYKSKKIPINKNQEDNNNQTLKSNNIVNKIEALKKSVNYEYIGKTNNDGIKEGFGIQKWNDGSKFIGDFKDDKANGYGIFYHFDGDVYSGEFIEDRLEGFGRYLHKNGAEFEGEWKNELQEGLGIEKWKDGSLYQGEFKEGKKDGIGSYTWSDGSYYYGQWGENSLNGYGIYYFSENKYYYGEWKDNMMNGFGCFVWKEGKKYLGYYVNDKKEGFGIYSWYNSDPKKIFVGFWKNGKQHGVGKFFINNKEKYGIWDNGKKTKWFDNKNEVENIIDQNPEQIKFKCFLFYPQDKIKKIIDKNVVEE